MIWGEQRSRARAWLLERVEGQAGQQVEGLLEDGAHSPHLRVS